MTDTIPYTREGLDDIEASIRDGMRKRSWPVMLNAHSVLRLIVTARDAMDTLDEHLALQHEWGAVIKDTEVRAEQAEAECKRHKRINEGLLAARHEDAETINSLKDECERLWKYLDVLVFSPSRSDIQAVTEEVRAALNAKDSALTELQRLGQEFDDG